MVKKVPAGVNLPDDFNVVIEISSHATPVKYELDKDTGLLMVDRFMPTSMHYPCNYGYVPSTLAEDDDPVDVLLMTPFSVQPGCLVRARPIGLLMMEDEKGKDNKVLAVPIEKVCAQYRHIHSLEHISQVYLESVGHFFEHYKDLEPNKWAKVTGWGGRDEACKEILASVERYK